MLTVQRLLRSFLSLLLFRLNSSTAVRLSCFEVISLDLFTVDCQSHLKFLLPSRAKQKAAHRNHTALFSSITSHSKFLHRLFPSRLVHISPHRPSANSQKHRPARIFAFRKTHLPICLQWRPTLAAQRKIAERNPGNTIHSYSFLSFLSLLHSIRPLKHQAHTPLCIDR